LTISYTPGADGEWSATITDNATGDLVGGIDLRFGPDGLLETINANNNATYDPVSGNLAFATSAGPISAFIGRSGENGGLTQLGATFSPFNVQSNGSPVGELQSVDITPDGFVQAIYDTGVRRTLFQIPVASVTNPDGLTAVDNQAFARSADSGDIYLWNAGDGPTGEIAGFTLMESTTDIAAELTALIETQRAYSSNAKIIQTVDEMLQETTNLKR
jgi:flagellar hook protein FlgE